MPAALESQSASIRPSRKSIYWRSALALSLASIYLAASGAYLLIDRGDHGDGSVFYPWFLLYSVQFAVFFAVVICFHRGWLRWGKRWILVALAARWLVIGSEPIMEADYFRYLWDGHVWSEGINPFLYAPEQPELDDIETGDRFFIQWSQYRTIYPAFSQFMFRLAHAISPDSLPAWKALLGIYDLALAGLLMIWLSQSGLAPHRLAWYLLNPLVLKEVFNSAHLDLISVFWTTLAVYLHVNRPQRRWAAHLSWVCLAIAFASKIYPLLLVPLFFQIDWTEAKGDNKRAFVGPAIFAASVLLLYAPFYSAGWLLFESTGVFARYWSFNAGLFRLIHWGWTWVGAMSGASLDATTPALVSTSGAPFFYQLPAKLTAGAMLLGVTEWQRRTLKIRQHLPVAALTVLGCALVLSPVVDAWYVLWILPLASFSARWGWLAFTYLVGLSYAWFVSPDAARSLWLLEYAAFIGLMGVAAWRRRQIA